MDAAVAGGTCHACGQPGAAPCPIPSTHRSQTGGAPPPAPRWAARTRPRASFPAGAAACRPRCCRRGQAPRGPLRVGGHVGACRGRRERGRGSSNRGVQARRSVTSTPGQRAWGNRLGGHLRLHLALAVGRRRLPAPQKVWRLACRVQVGRQAQRRSGAAAACLHTGRQLSTHRETDRGSRTCGVGGVGARHCALPRL